MGAGVRVEVLNVGKDLGGALPGTDNSDAVWLVRVGKDIGNDFGVLRGVDNPGVVERENFRDLGLSTNGDYNVLGSVGRNGTSLDVAAADGESLDTGRGGIGGSGIRCHRENFVVVLDKVIEMSGTPAKVVLELDTSGKEGVEVDEVNQPVMFGKVVKESELRLGIPQRGKILEEGNLHLCAGEEHASMPGERGLLLKEENTRGAALRANLTASGQLVMHGDSNGQASGAEANAKEIMDIGRVGGEEELRLLDCSRSRRLRSRLLLYGSLGRSLGRSLRSLDTSFFLLRGGRRLDGKGFFLSGVAVAIGSVI